MLIATKIRKVYNKIIFVLQSINFCVQKSFNLEQKTFFQFSEYIVYIKLQKNMTIIQI